MIKPISRERDAQIEEILANERLPVVRTSTTAITPCYSTSDAACLPLLYELYAAYKDDGTVCIDHSPKWIETPFHIMCMSGKWKGGEKYIGLRGISFADVVSKAWLIWKGGKE